MELAPYAPGRVARRFLGRHFEPLGNLYRRIFVDLNKIADGLSRELPYGCTVLDIGGGEGAVVERLLNRRPDLSITICDEAAQIGGVLSHKNRPLVKLLPATDFKSVSGPFDAVMISYVVHHIPAPQREAFFHSLAASCRAWNCRQLIVVDLEPGGFRAFLSWLGDRYISGDPDVRLFSRDDFASIAARFFPHAERKSKIVDHPSYMETLHIEP